MVCFSPRTLSCKIGIAYANCIQYVPRNGSLSLCPLPDIHFTWSMITQLNLHKVFHKLFPFRKEASVTIMPQSKTSKTNKAALHLSPIFVNLRFSNINTKKFTFLCQITWNICGRPTFKGFANNALGTILAARYWLRLYESYTTYYVVFVLTRLCLSAFRPMTADKIGCYVACAKRWRVNFMWTVNYKRINW
jgi:hypothetical protein